MFHVLDVSVCMNMTVAVLILGRMYVHTRTNLDALMKRAQMHCRGKDLRGGLESASAQKQAEVVRPQQDLSCQEGNVVYRTQQSGPINC